MNYCDVMFEILRAGLFGASVSEKAIENIEGDEYKKVFAVAKAHDFSHLLAYCFEKLDLFGDDATVKDFCDHEQFLAVYRYENTKYEIDHISRMFEEAEIPFILLKGSVIRRYYPEPWMRTSCDIDILIRPETAEKAKTLLTEKMGYEFKRKTSHDYQFSSPGNVSLELHYTIIGDDEHLSDKIDGVLDRVWDNLTLLDGFNFGYRLNDEMMYFYHLYHLAKHIRIGGCGIKPFLDQYYITKAVVFDDKKEKLVEEGGLGKVEAAVKQLTDVFFMGKDYENEQMAALGKYILYGGVYGNNQNKVAMLQKQRGGKVGYIIRMLFLPYDQLKYKYPVLEEKKWLYVPFLFRRLWEFVFGKVSREHTLKEFEANMKVSDAKINSVNDMWDSLGL